MKCGENNPRKDGNGSLVMELHPAWRQILSLQSVSIDNAGSNSVQPGCEIELAACAVEKLTITWTREKNPKARCVVVERMYFGGLDGLSSNNGNRVRIAGIVVWTPEFLTDFIGSEFRWA